MIYRMRKMSKDTTLKVTFVETREWKLRLWVSKMLIILAAKILGCGIEVSG